MEKNKEYTVLEGAVSINLPPNSITFTLKNNEPIIVIDEVGFKYKGELIEDTGEVYRLFKEFLVESKTQPEISDQEINDMSEYQSKIESVQYADGFYEGAHWYRQKLKLGNSKNNLI